MSVVGGLGLQLPSFLSLGGHNSTHNRGIFKTWCLLVNDSKVLRINSYSVCRTTAWTESGFSDQRVSTWHWSPVRHLSFGCWGCPARRGLTCSEPLKSLHWGAWASSLFLFSLPMASYSESYTILFRHYPTNSYQGEGLKFFNSNHCLLSMYFEEKCVEKPVLSRLLVQATKTKNFLVNWRAIWTWSPRNAPGLPTSLLSEAHF